MMIKMAAATVGTTLEPNDILKALEFISQTPELAAYKLGDQLCPVEFLFHYLFDELICDGYGNHLLLTDVCDLGKLTTETLCKRCGQQRQISYNWDIPHYIDVAIPWPDCSITDCLEAKLQDVPHDYSGENGVTTKRSFRVKNLTLLNELFSIQRRLTVLTAVIVRKFLLS